MPKLFMINIVANKGYKDRKELPFKIKDMSKEISKVSKNYWSVKTHYRENSKDKIKQFAFRLPYKKSQIKYVRIVNPENKDDFISLDFSFENNVWFDANIFYKKNRYLYFNRGIGVAESGFIEIYVGLKGQEDLILNVEFLPSSLSKQDYEIMLTELYAIHSRLIGNKDNIVNVSMESQNYIEKLNKKFKEIEKLLLDIDRNPHLELENRIIMKKLDKKWNKDAYIQAKINPGRQKYKHKVKVNSSTNYENKLIKQTLINLKKSLEVLSLYLQNQVNTRYIKEKEDLIYKFKTLDVKIDKDYDSNDKLIRKNIDSINNSIKRLLSQTYVSYSESLRNRRYNCKKLKKYLFLAVKLEINDDEDLRYMNNKDITKISYTYNKRSNFKSLIIKDIVDLDDKFSIKLRGIKNFHGNFKLKSEDLLSVLLMEKAIYLALNNEEIYDFVIYGMSFQDKNNIICRYGETNLYNYNLELTYIDSIYLNNKKVSIDSEEEYNFFLKNFILKSSNNSNKLFNDLERNKLIQTNIRNYKKINDKMYKLNMDIRLINNIIEGINNILELSTFKNIRTNNKLAIRPTNILIHEPRYNKVFKFLRNSEKELGLSFDNNKLNNVQVNKLHSIYEVWVLYKIIYLMTEEMGWSIKDNNEISSCLKNYIIKNKTLKDFKVTLFLNDFSIELYYEPKIYLDNSESYLTPDYVFKIKKSNKDLGILILDAKYRDYKTMGENFWLKDIEDVGIKKYGKISAKDPKWRLPIISSSIIHSDIKLIENNDYFPYIPYYMDKNSGKDKFKYSSIPFTPSNVNIFKNYLRMIFEYILGYYNICWNCGENEKIRISKLKTKGKNIKYHIECLSCNEFWVKSHCYNDKDHVIIKHNSNYLKENKKSEKSKGTNLICPICLGEL